MKSLSLKWPKSASCVCSLLICLNAVLLLLCLRKENNVDSVREDYEQLVFESFKTHALAYSSMKEGRFEVCEKILKIQIRAEKREIEKRFSVRGQWMDLITYIDKNLE